MEQCCSEKKIEAVERAQVPIGQVERVFHAVLFELSLLISELILFYMVATAEVLTASLLVVAMSLTAMVWNYVFNVIFDCYYGQNRLARSFALRLFHSLCFEAALVIVTTPMVIYALEMPWLHALMMGVGFALYALIFVFVFNWCFDFFRVYLIGPYPKERLVPGS